MKIAVLDRATLGDDLSLAALDGLGEICVYDMTLPEEVAERICDCDVVVTNKIKLNASNLYRAENLKLICVTATGYDNIDLAYCRAHHVALCNVVGYSTQSVAQLTVASALSLWHRLPVYAQYVRCGAYTQSGVPNCLVPPYHETEGMTWGIVGYGNIGKRVAEMARALGFQVLAFARSEKEGVENVDLCELCRRSDVISLHTPLNDGTRSMIDADMLARMKPSAILVNVARGGVWDECAVAQALVQGRIGGVASDVYTVEPFTKEHPFYAIRDREDVCLTPHMAWGAYEARARLIEEIAENIRSFSAGGSRNRIV